MCINFKKINVPVIQLRLSPGKIGQRCSLNSGRINKMFFCRNPKRRLRAGNNKRNKLEKNYACMCGVRFRGEPHNRKNHDNQMVLHHEEPCGSALWGTIRTIWFSWSSQIFGSGLNQNMYMHMKYVYVCVWTEINFFPASSIKIGDHVNVKVWGLGLIITLTFFLTAPCLWHG